ncbi:MAG: aconitase X [Clostridia bacterium]|nr:aconitase X [Clostridia bacterium]
MFLTEEQQAILDGKLGETKAKIMKTLIKYGELYGADKMVPVTQEYGHLVTNAGVISWKAAFNLMQRLIDDGALPREKFTLDPRPYDKNIPCSPVEKLIFKIVYSQQKRYEKQLWQLGKKDEDAHTCTCYLKEVGNIPKKGDILSWAESSAVVYANSVLGARCNRNSGILELFGSVLGLVPAFGFILDENRKADWIVEVKTTKKPEAQILGSAIGMKVVDQVPFVKGLDKFIGNTLDEKTTSYLKDFGAATASNGAVGLYHIENLTPEAIEMGENIIKEGAKTYVIDDAELERVKASYPVIWEDPNAKPKLCFIGCPHLSLFQLIEWTKKIEENLKKNGQKKVTVPTVFTTATAVKKEFDKTEYADRLKKTGVIVSFICPLTYSASPGSSKVPVITNSNKFRTYSTARYYTDDEIADFITKEVK